MGKTKIIDGETYTSGLLTQAKRAATDGQVSVAEARCLWDSATAGPKLSDIDKRTLQRTMVDYKYTDAAAKFLTRKIEGKATSYFKQIKGVQYDRDLWEEAEKMSGAEGGLTEANAKALIESAMDGGMFTGAEHRTLEYALMHFPCTEAGAAALRETLYPKQSETVVIDGAEYCRELLEMIEKYAKNGEVSEAQAMEIWDKACEGQPGVTDINKKTLVYALNKWSWSKDAQIYMLTRLRIENKVMTAEEACEIIAASLAGSSLDQFVKPPRPNTEERCDVVAAAFKPSDEVQDAVNKEVGKWRRQGLEKLEELEDEQEVYFGNFFDQMDTDGDGELTLQELKDYVAKTDSAAALKLGIGSWDDFVRNADLNNDGKIDREEFIIYGVNGNVDVEMAAGFLFDAMDTDGNNVLELDEIKDYEWFRNPHLFQVLGITDFSTWVEGLDTNKDGQVDRDEFISYMKGKLVEENGERKWKQSVDTAHTFQESGYHHNKKRKPDRNECWDYARGYCSRGANCRYTHKPESAVDVSVLQDKQKKLEQVCGECGFNLSSAARSALSTLEVEQAEELIRSVAEGGEYDAMDDEDKQFFITRKARRIAAQSSGNSWSSKRRRKT